SLSSAQSHSGSYSYVINEDIDAIQLTLASSYNKIVSMWFYDTATQTNMQVVGSVGDSVNTRSIGVNTPTSSTKYVYRLGGTHYATTITRTTGWHEFKWDYTSGTKLDMYIDGVLIASPTGATNFNAIAIGDYWPGNTTTAYFDDVRIYDNMNSPDVEQDKEALDIGYASGDSAVSVTQNVNLASSGAHGTTITWSSSNPSVIAADGTVTRPALNAGDANVTLTATISKGTASDTKTFTLTVLKQATFFDGFESGLGNWTSVPGKGTPSLSTAQAHSGSYSYVINEDLDAIQLTLASSYNKIVSMWFYDTATLTNMQVFGGVADSGNIRNIGVNTPTSTTKYVYRLGGTHYTTSIARTTGWHEFKWDYTSGTKVDMYIDGVLIASPTGATSFNTIAMGDFWAGNTTTAYFDDISIQ
ncbi:MAG: hypothetical protein J7639_28765, partial [Paenibacillaceae bacterium]|nr:hypothetical protein [Paenibacillaceae bacterium]